MTKEEYFGDWINVLPKKELSSIVNTMASLYSTKQITPSYKDIFKCFNVVSRRDTNVVILGQDPYPQKGVATGLAFANTDSSNISPSLKVLMKASGIKDVTLESIAKQGVLLLNTSLTTEVNKVGSHQQLWQPFISKFLKNLCEIETGLVFILLGMTAQSFEPCLGKYQHILRAYHPAYYAREGRDMPNTVFIKTNQILKSIYGAEKQIKWGSRD